MSTNVYCGCGWRMKSLVEACPHCGKTWQKFSEPNPSDEEKRRAQFVGFIIEGITVSGITSAEMVDSMLAQICGVYLRHAIDKDFLHKRVDAAWESTEKLIKKLNLGVLYAEDLGIPPVPGSEENDLKCKECGKETSHKMDCSIGRAQRSSKG